MTTLTIQKKDGSVAEVKAEPLQVPGKKWGDHSLTPNQINVNANINPATGQPFAQVMDAPRGGMISPPPTRNFR